MLVRARAKNIQEFPDWAKCCEAFLQYAEEHKDYVVRVDLDTADYRRVYCKFCKKSTDAGTAGKSVQFEHPGTFGALALLDLDEGPLEAAL